MNFVRAARKRKKAPANAPGFLFDASVRTAADLHQSPSGWRFTTRVRLRIMNRPVGFSSIATLNTARA